MASGSPGEKKPSAALAKLKHAEKMEMDILRMEAMVSKKKKKAEPASIRVFARWKPLKSGQVGLPLRMTKTSIEFEIPKETQSESPIATAAGSLKRQQSAKASIGGGIASIAGAGLKRQATAAGGGIASIAGAGLKRQASVTSAIDDKKPESFHIDVDGVFSGTSSQHEVYEETAAPLVDDLLEGFNATLFAYGQTGAGKTFSMYGPDEVLADIAGAPDEVRGIVPKTCDRVFSTIADLTNTNFSEVKVFCSMLEIYNERVNDLLMLGQDLRLREDKSKGVFVEGLASIEVATQQAVCDVITQGNKSRATSATAMNERSSRGHSVFMMEVVCTRKDNKRTSGKLYLIDLAGSEDVKKSKVTGDKQALAEAQNINKSLSALSNCIQKLSTGDIDHVPYRDSKLTRILQQALGGNCKTSLLVALRPEADCVVECIATLRFAKRAKQVVKKVSVNSEQLTPDPLVADSTGGGGGGGEKKTRWQLAGQGGGGVQMSFAEFAKKEKELAEARDRVAAEIAGAEAAKQELAMELSRLQEQVEQEHKRVEQEHALVEEHLAIESELKAQHEQDEKRLAEARQQSMARGIIGTTHQAKARFQAQELLSKQLELQQLTAERDNLIQEADEQKQQLIDLEQSSRQATEALEHQVELLTAGIEAVRLQQQQAQAAWQADRQQLEGAHRAAVEALERRAAQLHDAVEAHRANHEAVAAEKEEALAAVAAARAAAAEAADAHRAEMDASSKKAAALAAASDRTAAEKAAALERAEVEKEYAARAATEKKAAVEKATALQTAAEEKAAALARSAEQAAAQKESELKALQERAAAEKAAAVERAAVEKATAEEKAAMLERAAEQAAAQKEAELQRVAEQVRQLQNALLERGRPDAAHPQLAAEAGGAEAPARGREAEAELHALRAELSAVKAAHASAAAGLESAQQHARQMEEAFKTSLESANRYGRRMEDDREHLRQEALALREQLASLRTASEEKASALQEQLALAARPEEVISLREQLAALRAAQAALTPRRESSAEASQSLFCFAPRNSRVSARPDGGPFSTPILNSMMRGNMVSGVPSAMAVPTPEAHAQYNDAGSPHHRRGKSSGEHRGGEHRGHKHGSERHHPPPYGDTRVSADLDDDE